MGPPDAGHELHGRIWRAAADSVEASASWEGDEFVTRVNSTHREAAMFGENLLLERRWTIRLGQPEVELQDTIRNLAFAPEAVLLLYHFNLGHPLVSPGSELKVAASPEPRDERAAEGLDTAFEIGRPEVGFAEQAYFFTGVDRAELRSAALGLRLVISWDGAAMPHLTEWKNVAAGSYTVGIEPGTCLPLGRTEILRRGQGLMLEPGEARTIKVRVAVEPG